MTPSSSDLVNPSINLNSSDIELSGTPTISVDMSASTMSVSFVTVESGGRIDGLGSYSISLTKD